MALPTGQFGRCCSKVSAREQNLLMVKILHGLAILPYSPGFWCVRSCRFFLSSTVCLLNAPLATNGSANLSEMRLSKPFGF